MSLQSDNCREKVQAEETEHLSDNKSVKCKLNFNHPYKSIFWMNGFSESDIPKELLDKLYKNLKHIHEADKECGYFAGVKWILDNADPETRKHIMRKMVASISNPQKLMV
jgi:hypothetical protein